MMNDRDPLTGIEIQEQWILRLYIAGQSPQSVKATANLRKLCTEYLEGKHCIIQIIDLIENPQLAERDQIVVIPTLVRHSPVPVKKVYGDLSNTEKVLVSLQFPGQ